MLNKLVPLLLLTFILPATAQNQPPEQIVNALNTRWKEIQDYHCKMRSRNRLGNQTDEKRLDFWFKRPHQVRMEVLDGDKKGSVLTRDASGKIRARKGGIMSIIPVTLSEDDERTRNLRGRKFYQADWGSVIKEFIEGARGGLKLSQLPDETFNQVACSVVQLEGKHPTSPITRDLIWVDKTNNLILCRKQYEGDILVNEVVWWDIEMNTNPADNQFTL